MCVKLSLRDLNPGSCPSHPTSIYTYGVITALRVRSDKFASFLIIQSMITFQLLYD